MSDTLQNLPYVPARMTEAVEFRFLNVIVRVFRRLPAESQRWLIQRLQEEAGRG